METIEFKKAYNEAINLPTHNSNKELMPHYIKYEDASIFTTYYGDSYTALSIFEAMDLKQRGAERYYTKIVPTYRENGTLKKSNEWDKKLYFHKAWSRNDVEVTNVDFKIVGLKRQTTKLPAGILIADIKFS